MVDELFKPIWTKCQYVQIVVHLRQMTQIQKLLSVNMR